MERLIRVGNVPAKGASQITKSRIGIGFEKLDRNVFDPEKAYDKVAAIGVKWVRIQSGWQRTEIEKGVFDFAWLDRIVDELRRRGLVPWICLCYGNGLYTPAAREVFGAVGCPPIHTEEEREAWARYVTTLTARYRGKIPYYEVWNEPDGKWCWKHGVSGTEYGEFVVATSKAVRAGDPEAKVIGGSICIRDLAFLDEALRAGMDQAIDAMTFHEYTADETTLFERVETLRGLCDTYRLGIEIIQGESGSQSSSKGAGALRGGAWTPRKQAKQLLRHTLADLQTGVTFTSYFSSMDMIEALNGKVGDKASYQDYGYFGVLAADFDENGFATGEYTPKPSYYTLQTLCSVFAEDYAVKPLPVLQRKLPSQRVFGQDATGRQVLTVGFERPNGAAAYAYWFPTDLMTTEFESTLSVQAARLPKEVRLIDLMDGTVYKLPENKVEWQTDRCVLLKNLPLKDYPLLLTFGDFVGL